MPLEYEAITKSNQLRRDDIVIALMGPTGSGKSTIIDTLTGQLGKRAGNNLESCTDKVSAVRIKNHDIHKDHIVLLDTPGFDDTNQSDLQILEMIAKWLVDMYKKKKVTLTGMLYLHRITDNRMAGTPYRNLRMFGDLCGDKAARNVVLITTMWDKVKSREVGENREKDLKTNFWRPMIESGATVDRFENTQESAWKIINDVTVRHGECVALLLQEEMVELERHLKETTAGRALYSNLQNLLVRQKDTVRELAEQAKAANNPKLAADLNDEMRRIQKELEKTYGEMNSLHISLGRKFLLFFGGKPKARNMKLGQEK